MQHPRKGLLRKQYVLRMLRTLALLALGVSGTMAGAIRGAGDGYGDDVAADGAVGADGAADEGYGDEAAPADQVLEEEQDTTETETDLEAAKKGEKNWAKPNMKPRGFFQERAGVSADGINQTVLDTTFVPTMIPQDGFKISSMPPKADNHTELPPFQPPTVGHGELRVLRQKEDHAEDAEVEGDIHMKEEELQATQKEGACAMMENALTLARGAREEEAAMKVPASDQKALVDIVKMICPVLKYKYSFVMRCKKCADMVARLEKFYDPKFDTKVFPGLEHPEACDQSKWSTKNFALQAALTSPNLFFGIDFCISEADAEEADDTNDLTEEDGGEDNDLQEDAAVE